MSSANYEIEVVQYDSHGANTDRRISTLLKFFRNKYNTSANFVVQAPGRVNLIGDHIDYHGYAVLPMAIEKCIFLACSWKDGANTLCLTNTDQDQYCDWQGETGRHHGPELAKQHHWYNYFLCGYHGILETFVHEDSTQLGLNVAITSDLPAASGVSSSSALVCGSSVAVLQGFIQSEMSTKLGTRLNIEVVRKHGMIRSNEQRDSANISLAINKQSLASLCPIYERRIGTHSGGMDQAVIMTAEKGFAKYVEFLPSFACRNVKLPNGVSYMISHCGARYPKAATSGYNTRVLETRLGAAMTAKVAKLKSCRLDSSITWYAVQHEMGLNADDMMKFMKANVFGTKDTYTVDEVCERLELSRHELAARFNTSEEFVKEQLNDQLTIRSRSYHVVAEAERVDKFRKICETTQDVKALGEIMTDSHTSLRDLYECSHPALDTIVMTAINAGALGSRLTGAGWGGCAVILVRDSDVDRVTRALDAVSSFTIKTEPRSGCKIYLTS